MEDRSELKSASRGNKSSPSHSRKSGKKRGGRRSAAPAWCEEPQLIENGGPALDYRQMFWQSGVPPPHVQPHNGQRLFAAVSDPSVCGYSTVPMAYTMEPISVPSVYPLYQPLSRPNYRTFRGRPRRNTGQNGPSPPHHTLTNGYSSLQESRSNYSNPPAHQNGDYASLPPNANVDRSSAGEELNTEQRRYSDPGLADLARPTNSEESDSSDSGSSLTTVGKNKLVLSLVEQMTALRETNSRMFKELHETRTDLECVKSELARLKRGGASDYQPGMLSDIVRDMREANKALDEAMITKVNAMVDEQNRQRTMEFEKLRDQLAKISEEKDEDHQRIAELEEAVTALKLTANNEGREIAAFEEENLVLRRELQEARASRNMAENHVAKCVSSGLSRPITPVTFDPPCITSTPVRTEIRNSYGCPPPSRGGGGSVNDLTGAKVVTTTTTRTTTPPPRRTRLVASPESSDESFSRRGGSASPSKPEVNYYRLSSSSTSSSTPSSPSSSSRCDDRAEIDEEWRWRTSRESAVLLGEHGGQEEDCGSALEANERLIVIPTNRRNILPGHSTNEGKIHGTGSRIAGSGGFVNVGANGRNETPDVVDDRKDQANKPTVNLEAGKKCRKRAITEVPDVIVVAGKPVVPKDLCSTRILTSRVLTRATYTTAYI